MQLKALPTGGTAAEIVDVICLCVVKHKPGQVGTDFILIETGMIFMIHVGCFIRLMDVKFMICDIKMELDVKGW